ncbi:MAG: heme lyase CcmF/NrfE family subunit [Gammaproteobacteria bacterium]|nr:heme lyase CcmF/NrfE family subunit [Gammaproteobacteria bacterium]
MVAEFGHFSLIISLFLALMQTVIPQIGASIKNQLWMSCARPLVLAQSLFILLSFICLVFLFINDDFSVRYVAENSNTLLPDRYKISAVWGAHEGSLLLWVLILAFWSLAVSMFSSKLPIQLVARVLAVLGFISVGFYLFMLFTSNPFDRSLPYFLTEGADLNPLLQDVGLIFHPPILYMGYVGLSVAFAFSVAALLNGSIDSAWARWVKPWTLIAWMFLTLGISLGSWWAYYELGWGGWWFWDPVENASLMPWLVCTALIHSLSVTEKRGAFASWTLLLAIMAFSLSLLGTFLVRSGVLTSVHAFATDPARGIFILIFLIVVIGGSLLLFAFRGPTKKSSSKFSGLSKELFILANNLILIIITAVILLGTLYPLIADVLGWGKISVGPPYFNLFFVPLTLLLGLLMPVASILRWKKTPRLNILKYFNGPLILSVIIGGSFPLMYESYEPIAVVVSIFISSWIILITLRDIGHKSSTKVSILDGLKRIKISYWGMVTAHIGVAICIIGVGLTTAYSIQRDVRMLPGETISLANYQFEFVTIEPYEGPNYIADQATVLVTKKNSTIALLKPQKRRYFSSGQTMTEASIDSSIFRDLYIALGEPLQGDAWAIRIYIKPFVMWIWIGALFIAMGAVLASLDGRFKKIQ